MRSVTRRVGAVVSIVLAVAACTPAASKAPVYGSGGATAADPGSTALLARDVDHPAEPACAADRYNPPAAAALPAEYASQRLDRDYRYTSARSASKASSQHFLCGQRGPAIDQAWGVTQGRRDVTIAVLDSGIKWRDASVMKHLAGQVRLNAGELPVPQGCTVKDCNGDGVVTVDDYAHDPRVTDANHNGVLDPEDLIAAFSDGVDGDHNGYVDDIAGWNVLQDDNDPFDDVDYGHGTGEATDSVSAAGSGSVGVCPGCTFVPVKVADSFIADGGRFAAGVMFALDSNVSIVQEALGALNNPSVTQRAIDAAYARGVPIVASMADEESEHPNLPAASNHTIPVNSITTVGEGLGDLGNLLDDDYLSLNGCTNYGGVAWVSVPSSSCSSAATGLGAGMVGLIESAARTGGVAPYGGRAGNGGNVLSANEVAQLLRGTADDVDFATPHPGEPANEQRTDLFQRYPTTPGWDATTGYGRVNTYEAVRAAAAGDIPPEADITGPTWFSVLPATGTVDVVGTTAATRSSSYSWTLQWATGLQPPAAPAADVWHTVSGATGATAPRTGVLGTLDLAAIAAALPDGARGASSDANGPLPDKFTVRVRLVVTDAEGRHGVAQHQVFVHDDPDLVAGFPRAVPGAGASSPAFADLTGDGHRELVLGTDDGQVHAFRPDGTELPGWPVSTPVASYWHAGATAVTAAGLPTPHEAIGIGAPVIADLDHDGHTEVAVTDAGGNLSVWDSSGHLRFRRSVDPDYSRESATDPQNRLKRAFLAQPAAADLDGDGRLELVAAAMDRHVYAWHADGTPVAGFPVLVVDPTTASTVDPVTHHVDFSTHAGLGGELITTPAIGDLLGNGHPVIVVGAQEQYTDEPPAVFPGVGLGGVSANTREYAIWGDGTAHPAAPGAAHSADPDANAYLPGWPVKLAMVKAEVLPTVGNGVSNQAAIGDVTGTGKPSVVVTSADGPVYVLDAAGHSPYDPIGHQQVALDWLGAPFGANATSHDGGVLSSAFGGPSIAALDGSGHLDVATETVGLGKAIDQLLPGHQDGDTQLMAWDGHTAHPLAGFPHRTSDLAFFVTPALVDVGGGTGREVVAANGVNLLDAVDATGAEAPGYPKLTGGWSVGTPGYGDWLGDGHGELALTRRDGTLFVWRTAGTPRAGDWSRAGRDGTNAAAAPG